jgi:hypothetical protein
MTNRRSTSGQFAQCIRNGEYEGDLIVGKVYRVVKPKSNDRPSDIRILDESGADYLYPQGWFVLVHPARPRGPWSRPTGPGGIGHSPEWQPGYHQHSGGSQ